VEEKSPLLPSDKTTRGELRCTSLSRNSPKLSTRRQVIEHLSFLLFLLSVSFPSLFLSLFFLLLLV
jgi:hypothetical protein